MVWQVLQGLGALAGFISGAYLILDRWTKHRPDAYIVAKGYKDLSTFRDGYLRVRNRSERPMLVKLRGGRKPGLFVPAVDHETDSIIHSTLEGTTTIVLDGGETADLLLMPPPDLDQIDIESEIVAGIDWQFAQPLLWRGDRRITASIQKRAYDRLLEGKSRDWGDRGKNG